VVLEFQGKKIDDETLKTLADAVRGGALEGLSGRGVDVMTRENMMAMLKAMGKRECNEGECEVETARNIGADFVVSGTVTRIEDTYVVTLKMHESNQGNLLGTDMIKAKTQLEILDSLREHGRDLVRMYLGRSSGAFAAGGRERQIGAEGGDFTVNDNRVLVKFESDPPGATVMMDAELLCRETPCSRSIGLGRHQVEMHKERYARAQQTIEGKRGAIVHAILSANFGTLIVRTNPPGLPVALDGKAQALMNGMLDVDPGQHELVVDHPCFQRTGEQVVAKSGERREVVLTGTPRMSAVAVTAESELGNEVEAKVAVDGAEVGTAPGTFKVHLCSREIVVYSPRGGFRGPLRLVEKEVVPVRARLWGDMGEPAVPVAIAPTPPAVDSQPASPITLAIPGPPAPATEPSMRPLYMAGLVCAGAGLASMGAGIYYYTQARSYSDKVSSELTWNASDYQAGKDAQTMQWVFYSIGAAATATGAVLFILGSSSSTKTSSVSLAPLLAPSAAGLSAHGAF
jgi:TolB-like protein